MGGEGKKGTQDVTKMTGLTKSIHQNHFDIQFNKLGNLIGPNRIQFVSYVGTMIQTIMCVL